MSRGPPSCKGRNAVVPKSFAPRPAAESSFARDQKDGRRLIAAVRRGITERRASREGSRWLLCIAQSTRMSIPDRTKGKLFKRRDGHEAGDDGDDGAARAAVWPRRDATETKRGRPSLARKQAEPRRNGRRSTRWSFGPVRGGGEGRRAYRSGGKGEKRDVDGPAREDRVDEPGRAESFDRRMSGGGSRREGGCRDGREGGGVELLQRALPVAAACGWTGNPANSIAVGRPQALGGQGYFAAALARRGGISSVAVPPAAGSQMELRQGTRITRGGRAAQGDGAEREGRSGGRGNLGGTNGRSRSRRPKGRRRRRRKEKPERGGGRGGTGT